MATRHPRVASHLPAHTPARDVSLSALRDAGRRLGRAGYRAHLICAEGDAASDRGAGGGADGGAGGWCGVAFDVEALRVLALPSGGSLILERRAGCEASKARLALALSGWLASVEHRGTAGCVSVRCSPGLSVSRVVGPAMDFDASTDAAEGESGDDGVCYVGGLHTAACLSLVLDSSAARPDSHDARAIVQVALWYTTGAGERRLRTFTVQPALTPDPTVWLSSIDTEATALLAARLAALEACAREKEVREPGCLSRLASELAAEWAACHGRPRMGEAKGWLWTSKTLLGYTLDDPTVVELVRRLHGLCTCAASVRPGHDVDAVQEARLTLLTAPAAEAALAALPPAVAFDKASSPAATGDGGAAGVGDRFGGAGAQGAGGGGEGGGSGQAMQMATRMLSSLSLGQGSARAAEVEVEGTAGTDDGIAFEEWCHALGLEYED